ncbi:DUF397 domain-containing protein [Streptomyces albus subsp. chlorinus]|uniref:DUF397 domain-containing protein n=1 Tax=Streptomyces albus TaxID=1888 RepID=UPI00156D8952|nr:DUF397 domain-containing protein [Streptomyces albus]NSC21794.1 DUF397 domain-containing protein [Streptomyces albus subsp. chlorinus]
MSTTELSWYKSSYSSADGDNCVEVAMQPETVHIRDTKDTDLHPLTISPTAWAAFTAHAGAR